MAAARIAGPASLGLSPSDAEVAGRSGSRLCGGSLKDGMGRAEPGQRRAG